MSNRNVHPLVVLERNIALFQPLDHDYVIIVTSFLKEIFRSVIS